MDEISDDTVLSEELVHIISAEETEDVVQRQESVADESENVNQIDGEANQKEDEKEIDVTELFQPQLSDDMCLEEIISYMADLESSSIQKVPIQKSLNWWYVDSGRSRHMTGEN